MRFAPVSTRRARTLGGLTQGLAPGNGPGRLGRWTGLNVVPISQPKLVGTVILVGLLVSSTGGAQGPGAGNPVYLPLPKPTLTIGAIGGADYEFVKIRAALRLPTGEIAVADLRTPTIRLYDAKGKLVRSLGREGAGPGEFRAVYSLFLAADTLIAYDWNLRRLTRFLPAGILVGTELVQPAAEDGTVVLAARLANGRWLVTTPHSPNWTHGHGVYRDTVRVGTIAASGTGAVRWVRDFPGMTFFAYMPGSNKSQWLVGHLPVAATTLVEALGDTIVVGDPETPDLLYFLPDGRQVHRVTLPLDEPTDLRYEREAAREEALAERGGQAIKAAIQASFEAPRPPPRYRDFTISTERRIWIRLFEEGPTDPTRYLVLDAAGGVRARVSLPPRSRVLSVQGAWVMVALRDEDDVERVGVIRWASP